jgi:hypothetical protein
MPRKARLDEKSVKTMLEQLLGDSESSQLTDKQAKLIAQIAVGAAALQLEVTKLKKDLASAHKRIAELEKGTEKIERTNRPVDLNDYWD